MFSAILNTTFSAASKWVSALGQRALKKAELTELNNVTFPRLYHALGKALLQSPDSIPELEIYRDKIRDLESQKVASPEGPAPEPPINFTGRVTQFTQLAADKTTQAVANAALTMKIQAVYMNAGRAAFKAAGKMALPQHLLSQLTSAFERRAMLESELLAAAPRSRAALTGWPKGFLAVGILMYVASWFLHAQGFGREAASGWSLFWTCAKDTSILSLFCVLSNVVAIASAYILWRYPDASYGSLQAVLAAMVVSIAAQMWLSFVIRGPALVEGAVVWFGSFIVLALVTRRRLLKHSASSPLPEHPGGRALAVACGCMALVMLAGAAALSRVNNTVAKREADAIARKTLLANERAKAEAKAVQEERAMMQTVQALMQFGTQVGAQQKRQADATTRQIDEIVDGMQRGAAQPQNYGHNTSGYGGASPMMRQMQMWEGRCTRCGWSTGRQATQGTNRCIQIGGGGVPCGGVVVWSPVQ